MSVICQLTLVSDFFGAGRVQYRLLGMKADTGGVRRDSIALTLVSHLPPFRDRVGDFSFPLVGFVTPFLEKEMASVDALSHWVDVTVLGEEPSVDSEFITHLRTRHRICSSEEDEPKYELVAPGPEDRICFGRTLRCLFYVIAESLLPSFTPTLGASPCEKYGLDDLDDVEAAIVGFLREAWGRSPYLDTKKFLQGSPSFIQAQIEMAKTNAQESYQRVQEAKARSRARSGGARAVASPPPPPRNVGTPSQPIVISSSASSLPPPSVRPTPEPEKRKRKTLESGASGEADALAFESLKTAGVCGKLLDIFEKTPLSSLGMTSRVEELEGRLRIYQEHERELEGKVAKLKEERDSLREKEKKLQAQCNMEVDLRKAAQASYNSLFDDLVSVKNDLLNARKAYTELEDSIADGANEAWRVFKEQVGVIVPDLDLSPLDPDKIVIDGAIVDPPVPVVESESDLKTRGQRIIESPSRSKDAPSSSTAPPAFSPTPGPGGGDPSTPLAKK
ncbi:uncharacterized protein DS421_13g420870 [Arachis hypogaea]|nr:uncharacterized protein DS421_13g420870 [Arachis hypogaea]